METRREALPAHAVRLLPGLFQQRFELNRRYVMSLRDENLLQNYYLEAGIRIPGFDRLRNTLLGDPGAGDDRHWGWESPTCQLRGHFLGHWLSAAARIYACTADPTVKLKADYIVAELARCQEKHGGEWVGPIPEKYLYWTAKGQPTWAPQYVIHKLLMGLYDMYAYAGNQQALEIMVRLARWFHRWTAAFSREQMDDLLGVETGGMLEAWADLYSVTGEREHRELLYRYDRPRLFEPLLRGEDVLTNMHANTTIPEAHGAARAYEVTGEERWRRIAEAYWRCAVTERGYFCTGGQTDGEVWTPPFRLSARLGDKNQEHCTVYNMIRLADYLFRWTGEASYADYIERNIYNGILAQQHPRTGMVAYFLPLQAGARKIWSTPTYDFWCCVGTMVQAHSRHNAYIYYRDAEGLAVCQYIPSEAQWEWKGVPVTVRQTWGERPSGEGRNDFSPARQWHRPDRWRVEIEVRCEAPVEFALKLRLPWWLSNSAAVAVNGQPLQEVPGPSAFCILRRTWQRDTVRLELPKKLTACPLPDDPDTVAFLDGPVVLAGLCEEERMLYGDKEDPTTMLTPDNEREWGTWLPGYRAKSQPRGLRFKPLYEVVDERYSVYFPVRRG